jgi:biopolymer transport protein ExbD
LDIFGDNNKAKILGSLNGSRRNTIGLRIAPMIDMIFLLLIFFLVAARWKPKEDFLPLQLPVANAQLTTSVGRPEPLAIQITAASGSEAGCQVQISSSHAIIISSQNPEQGLAFMMEATKQCLLEQKRYASDPVEIICAPDVKWEYIAKIYNVLVGMGLKDITFQMTEAPENAPNK